MNTTQDNDFSTCQDPECVADYWAEGSGDDDFGDTGGPGSFDLDAFSFDFFGTNLTAGSAQLECPDAWSATVSCVITVCPDFLEVCPTLDIVGEDDDNYDDIPAFLNSTTGNMTIPSIGCSELAEGFCDVFTFPTGCCLSDCTAPIYELVSCMAASILGEEASTCETPACVGPNDLTSGQSASPVLVNSSFLLSSLKGQNAAELREELKAGRVEVLQEAYRNFVQSVVDSFLGTEGPSARKLLTNSWTFFSGHDAGRLGNVFSSVISNHARRQLEKMGSKLDPGSAEIYDFVDTPCMENVANGEPTAVSRQGENTTCVTAFGRYRILADPEEDVSEVYESFVEATQAQIAEGNLEESLEGVAQNGTTTFVVEGVSTVVDESFSPFAEIEAASSDSNTETSDKNSTTPATNAPATAAPTSSNATQTQDSSASMIAAFPLSLLTTAAAVALVFMQS